MYSTQRLASSSKAWRNPHVQKQVSTLRSSRSLSAPTMRGYASEASSSSSAAAAAPKPRKSIFRRLLMYMTLTGLVVYGGGAYASLKSDRFRDSFTDSVPFAESIVDMLEQWQLRSSTASVASKSGRAPVDHQVDAPNKSKEAASSPSLPVPVPIPAAKKEEKKPEPVKQKQQEQPKESKPAPATSPASASAPTSAQAQAPQAPQAPAPKSTPAPEQQQQNKRVEQKKQERGEAKDDRPKVGYADALPGRKLDASPQEPKEQPGDEYTGPPLPLGFEPPPGYKVSKNQKKKQKQDESGQWYPLVSAISDLSANEPVLGDIAATIDNLASFLKDDNISSSSSTEAAKVLDTARTDLEKLASHIDKVRQQERTKGEAEIEKQAQIDAQRLAAREREAITEVEKLEDRWREAFEEERKKLQEQFREKLEQETLAYRKEVEGRLREEVAAQGVAMQRRWLRDVKVAVENERGGRLARLDSLERDLRSLAEQERVNEVLSERQQGANRLWTSVRALAHSALSSTTTTTSSSSSSSSSSSLSTTSDESSPSPSSNKNLHAELSSIRSIAAENARIRREGQSISNAQENDSTPSTADSEGIVEAVVSAIQNTLGDKGSVPNADELAWRFTGKVAPALRKAALMPEREGNIVQYFVSSAASSIRAQTAESATEQSQQQQQQQQQQGEYVDVEGLVGRAESLLSKRDIEGAARLLNKLEGWPHTLASDWLDQARRHLELRQALTLAETEASLQSLAVSA